MTDNKTPADRALDLFVYAPLGFLLEAREVLPKLAERGRGQVDNQVNMARMVGQFAVNTGKSEAQKRFGAVQEQAVAALGELGLWPAPDTAPAASEAAAPATPAPSADGAATDDDAPAVDTLAIPDYDGLAASQVVPRLEGLADGELEAVRRYEASHRGRKTVLGKIAQLQSA
ncbi:MAG TPA: hypothetical protein VHA73_08395 [Acidimicrobiales bacterium]|nr:hypothetical protein [Acidimicrobiales bacterium]